MKDRETQLAFIQARAEGKSYSTIAKELGIAKATCSSWEQTFKEDIETMKRERLEELYTAYNMKREARIQSLGTMLQKIDSALEDQMFRLLDTDKLLELKLKYMKALREEYREPAETEADNTLDGLLDQYNQLYSESMAGNYTPAEIKAQLSILDAKRETIYRLAGEQTREEEGSPLDFSTFDKAYKSKIIRHEDRRGA